MEMGVSGDVFLVLSVLDEADAVVPEPGSTAAKLGGRLDKRILESEVEC